MPKKQDTLAKTGTDLGKSRRSLSRDWSFVPLYGGRPYSLDHSGLVTGLTLSKREVFPCLENVKGAASRFEGGGGGGADS